MSLDEFRRNGTPDYTDYDEELATEIDKRIDNEGWLSNRKQTYYVVKTAEYALTKSYPPEMRERRRIAQEEVKDEVPVEDRQTIQKACHTRLFEGYEDPPTNYQGESQWYVLFDDVLRSIESNHRSDFPR